MLGAAWTVTPHRPPHHHFVFVSHKISGLNQMRANNSLPLQWKHLESTRTLQNELQRETKRLHPQSQGGRAESAGEEKWGCRMNEFEVVHEKFLSHNLQRDGDKMLEVLLEGERGGGDVLLGDGAAGMLTLFGGIPPLMAPDSHS